jgi:hypothetical protein
MAQGGCQMAEINHWTSKHFQFHQKSTIMNRQSDTHHYNPLLSASFFTK